MRRLLPLKGIRFFLNLAATATIATVLALASAQTAAAATTSAGATIHNVVQVDYKLSASGTVATIYSTVDVTVSTVPSTPTWYAQSAQTVAGGTVTNYLTSTLRSNANGPDTYNLGQSVGSSTNADPQTLQSITSSTAPVIWGGITVQAAATSGGAVAPYSGILYFPGGSVTAAALPNGTILELTTSVGVRRYTVTGVNAGTPNTQAAGTATNEAFAQVTVTPVSGLAVDQLGTATVAVGTQIGQVVTVTFVLTAGNPILAGTAASDLTVLTAQGQSTTAGGATASAATANITTNITSGVLAISKKSRILGSSAAINGTTNIVPANYDTSVKAAKAGNIIEYLITVTNPSGNGPASSVLVKDPTPAYTTFVTGSQSIGTAIIAVTPVTGVTTVADGSAVWSGTGYTYSNLPGNTALYIVYQVTVN